MKSVSASIVCCTGIELFGKNSPFSILVEIHFDKGSRKLHLVALNLDTALLKELNEKCIVIEKTLNRKYDFLKHIQLDVRP